MPDTVEIEDIATTKTAAAIDPDGDYMVGQSAAGNTFRALVEEVVRGVLAGIISDLTIGDDVIIDGHLGIGGSPEATRPLAIKRAGQSSMAVQTTDDTTGSFAGIVLLTNGSDIEAALYLHDTTRTVSRWGVTLGGWAEVRAANAGLAGMAIGTGSAVPLLFGTNNSERMRIDGNGRIIMSLPTSSAGLPTGALWNDGGTVKIA